MSGFDQLVVRIGMTDRTTVRLQPLHARRQTLLDAFAEAERAATECHHANRSAKKQIAVMAAIDTSIEAIERDALDIIADFFAEVDRSAGGDRG